MKIVKQRLVHSELVQLAVKVAIGGLVQQTKNLESGPQVAEPKIEDDAQNGEQLDAKHPGEALLGEKTASGRKKQIEQFAENVGAIYQNSMSSGSSAMYSDEERAVAEAFSGILTLGDGFDMQMNRPSFFNLVLSLGVMEFYFAALGIIFNKLIKNYKRRR